MEKVTFVIIDEVEHAIIENADGSFTSMHKAVYDAQVEHLTPPAE